MAKLIKEKPLKDDKILREDNKSRVQELEELLQVPFASKSGVEEREKELIYLSTLETERRIRNGTASSQLLLEYVQRGSSTAELKKEMLQHELELTKAKVELIKATAARQEQFDTVVAVLKRYRGSSNVDEDVLGDDEDREL